MDQWEPVAVTERAPANSETDAASEVFSVTRVIKIRTVMSSGTVYAAVLRETLEI